MKRFVLLLAAMLALNSIAGEVIKSNDHIDIKIENAQNASGVKGLVGTIDSSGVNINTGMIWSSDFLRGALGSNVADAGRLSGNDDILVVQDTSAAGAPTINYVSNASGGAFRIQLATTNEVEAVTLYSGDLKPLNISKGVFFETRVTITPDVTGAGGTLAAGDKIVLGLASNRNATLDNITTNAWFLIKAGTGIYVETDDNTTDNDDIDSGTTWTSGTAFTLRVEIGTDLYARFYVNGVKVKTYGMTALSANTMVQPYIEVAKAAAANMDHRVDIDRLTFGQYTR